jgi:hypothetical protein
VTETKNMQAEQGDWAGVDKNSKAALEAFLKRHPGGRYSGSAVQILADLEWQARVAEADEAAWKSVNRTDQNSIRNYLRQFPSGKHHDEAEETLAALRRSEEVSRKESAEILRALRQYADAWSAKDVDAIVALQRGLDKRLIKTELSDARAIAMSLTPTAPPQIEGTRAIVVCRRRVEQVFSDGIRKKNPESIVTFLLAKRNGAWAIVNTR